MTYYLDCDVVPFLEQAVLNFNRRGPKKKIIQINEQINVILF